MQFKQPFRLVTISLGMGLLSLSGEGLASSASNREIVRDLKPEGSSTTANPAPLLSAETTPSGKKKKKKKRKKNRSKESKESPASATEDSLSSDSPSASASSESAYVSGSVPDSLEFDRYPVSILKSEKGGVRAAGAFVTESEKTTFESSDGGSSSSGTQFLINADYLHKIGIIGIVPTFWFGTASSSIEYTTVNATGQPEDVKSTASTTLIAPGAGVAIAVTPMFDVGLNLDYIIGSRKSEDSSSSFSILSFDFGMGAHTRMFEGGFGYRPGSKYKTKVSSDAGDSEGDGEYPSRMNLMGRYLVSAPIFVGLQYDSESMKDYSESNIDFEGGMTSGGMQYGASIGLADKKIGESKESGFRLLGHVLIGTPTKQSFGVSGGFQSSSGSSEFSKSTSTQFFATASANIAF